MANDNTRVPPEDTAWDPQQVAHYLKVSERHVRDLRREDDSFPPPRMLGRKPGWSPDVVRRWVADGGAPRPPAAPAGTTGPKRKGPGRV
jgi:predicted DNA-binding transcriptional regulator AlpA